MGTDTEAPNHHADHPGFSGLRGLVGAISMAFGREETAAFARELVALAPGDQLVDIGCGPGAAACRAAALGAEVVGIDPAAVMLRVARLRDPRSRVRFVEGRAEDLPLGDASATVAWSLASVHHWPDVAGGIAEAHRVLAPGGRFVAIERRIESTGAAGLAGHGWTEAQATTFARSCERAGLVGAEVVTRDLRRGTLIAVAARLPD